MSRRTPFFLFAPLLLAACSQAPDTYAPPVQRQALTAGSMSGNLGHIISMSEPTASAYIVHDISDTTESGGFRWTYRRPELRFYLDRAEHLHFVMDFALPERIMREIAPVTLTFLVNGKLLERKRYETGGMLSYRQAVPPEMLRAKAENFVAVEQDKVWVSKTDGAVLGFVLARAGFAE